MEHLRILWPEMVFAQHLACQPDPQNAKERGPGDVVRRAVLGWMALAGPITSRALGERLGIDGAAIWQAMLALEMQGTHLRGQFEGGIAAADQDVEWCE